MKHKNVHRRARAAVVEVTCPCCGSVTDYDGSHGLSDAELQSLKELQCERCGHLGVAIELLPIPSVRHMQLKDLPVRFS
jgi:hypothetical protein